MFGRRRRPLMRAAMVGGTAYVAGKHVQQGHERESEQEERLQALENQQYAPPPQQYAPPPPPAPGPSAADATIQQLAKLAELRDQGVLTEEEFAAQKRRVLGG